MKLIGNVEVSGINRVVFYNTGEAWVKADEDEVFGEEPIWLLEDGTSDRIKYHADVINIIKRKLAEPDMWKIWIHGETINIVPKDYE